MYTTLPIRKGLQELYSYPERLTVREAYKIAWHLARILRYQMIVLEYDSSWEYNEYYRVCAAYGIPDSISDAARHHLKIRNSVACTCEFCQRYQ